MTRRLLLTLAILVGLAFPTSGQQEPFDALPQQTTRVPTQELSIYDATQTDPQQRLRRMTVATLIGGLGGSTTFLGLTDVSATAIVDGQCVAGVSGALGFQACGGTDTDTHVEIRGSGMVVRTNPAFVDFLGNRVLSATTGSDGVALTISGPLIYSEGTLVFADPTVLDFTGAGVTTTVNTVSGLVSIAIPGGSGGMADGVATAGAFNSTSENIDFTVTTPGANFSVDVSALVGGGGGQTLTAALDDSGLEDFDSSAITFFPAGLPRYGTMEVSGTVG